MIYVLSIYFVVALVIVFFALQDKRHYEYGFNKIETVWIGAVWPVIVIITIIMLFVELIKMIVWKR